MTMAKGLLVLQALCLLALTGCESGYYKPANPFNYKDVEWAAERGTNTVTGKVEALGSDGKSYPCEKVGLAPDSPYFRELAAQVMGTSGDAVVLKKDMGLVAQADNWQVNRVTRQTSCGWKGNFTFERVPDGVWYLSGYGGPTKAGYLFRRRVELRGNEKIVIDLP
jgi:hypothetical protein